MTGSAEALARSAYAEARQLLIDETLGAVAQSGLTVLYGPPVIRPDLMLVSFQGGGADGAFQYTWPRRLVYLDDETKSGNAYRFGRNLCRFARETGLYDDLETSTVATNAIFPQSADNTADIWLSARDPWARWRAFSTGWVHRFVRELPPRVVIIFGDKTSKALGLEGGWRDVSHNHGQGWRTYGVTEIHSVPTLFCTHLSRPVRREAIRSFSTVRSLLGV